MDNSSSVMIALLPTRTDWCKQELPHMTLVYAGKKDDLSPGDFNELAKDAAAIAMIASPLVLKVIDVDVFGDEEKVDVLKLEPTSQVLAMRRTVEHWNASEHPFNPHATIGPAGSSIVIERPLYLTFDRIMVGWGDEQLTFWLRS